MSHSVAKSSLEILLGAVWVNEGGRQQVGHRTLQLLCFDFNQPIKCPQKGFRELLAQWSLTLGVFLVVQSCPWI